MDAVGTVGVVPRVDTILTLALVEVGACYEATIPHSVRSMRRFRVVDQVGVSIVQAKLPWLVLTRQGRRHFRTARRAGKWSHLEKNWVCWMLANCADADGDRSVHIVDDAEGCIAMRTLVV